MFPKDTHLIIELRSFPLNGCLVFLAPDLFHSFVSFENVHNI